jgi:enterochelin esterase-like enzyme
MVSTSRTFPAEHSAGRLARRMDRRRFAGGIAALAGALVATGRRDPSTVRAETSAAPGTSRLALTPFSAGAAPFDTAGRRNLAMDLLTFFARQQGLFPGRGVYLLPAAPWFGGHEPMAKKRAWDIAIPTGQPLYLLANAVPYGRLDPAHTTITVNDAAVPDISTYVHGGVPALHDGEMRHHAVLDLVFAPPGAGRYQIEITTLHSYAVADDSSEPAPLYETVLFYDITVHPIGALGSLLLREPSGRIFATHGHERRYVPDPETLQALDDGANSIVAVSAPLLDALPEREPLPMLRDGMLVRADNHPAVFQLRGGKRVWQRYHSPLPDGSEIGSEVRTVDAAILSAIPPVLQDDMLIKGISPDVYHVDRGTLRKVPDWKWVADRRLDPINTIFVPDHIISTLPQNSPHWMMPGGSWQDRAFFSQTLGREMPYRVYLPPGYGAASRASQRYPVIYLLHGMSGRYDEWSGYGVETAANELLADGKFVHAIIVAPQGGLGYWMNQEGGTPWADYVARDVVGHIDGTYRTFARREARAIGGLSMGAHGAVQIALNFPEVFGIAGAHSPSIRSAHTAPAYFGKNGAFERHDPISLVRNSQLSTPPRIWIDAGTRDPWKPTAEALHRALQERGWAHEWHVFSGEHDGWYWGDHLWDYLSYYSTAFEKNGIPVIREPAW